MIRKDNQIILTLTSLLRPDRLASRHDCISFNHRHLTMRHLTTDFRWFNFEAFSLENVCHFSHGHAMVTKNLDFIHKHPN